MIEPGYFTNAEKERINQLYGNDFEGITPDDAQLIGRWEAWKAVNDDEHKTRMEAMIAESNAKLEQSRAQSEAAMGNLEMMRDMALKRYEETGNANGK